MRSQHVPQPALDDFVGELVEAGALLSQVVAHMHSSESSSSSPPIPVVLAGLVTSVIERVAIDHGRVNLEIATAVLSDAVGAMHSEILLVPPARGRA